MHSANWLKRIDLLLLGAIAILSIIISILDFFDVLGKIPWLNLDVSTMGLLLLGTTALFLVVDRRNFMEENFHRLHEKMDKMLNSPEEIVRSLNGVRIQTFDTPFDLLEYATRRVGEAKKWIDDTSWGNELGYEAQLPQNKTISIEHRDQIAQFAQTNTYREIFIFDQPFQKDVLKRRLENKEISGYSCAYYENPSNVLLLKFMIIDNEEVILLADNFKGNMAIKHPEIVSMFKSYYQILWDRATVIKDAKGIRRNIVDRLVKKFKTQETNFDIVFTK
jgi:hypothetical protein